MKQRLNSIKGKVFYILRKETVESVFGIIKVLIEEKIEII